LYNSTFIYYLRKIKEKMNKIIIVKSKLLLICLLVLPLLSISSYAAPVDLGTSGNFVVLAKSGISTTSGSTVVGDIGVSPMSATAITGFGLIMDPSGTFSTSSLVTGKVYAADYTNPTPTYLTTAIGDMSTAYTDAAGRAAGVTELGAGDIGGMTITPDVYKWSSGVTIPADVTLLGGEDDVWIFQIAGNLDISSSRQVILSGGAQARNIFWQVAGQTTLETTSQFKGIILSQTAIVISTGAKLDGRALAQTAVTLDGVSVLEPGTICPSADLTEDCFVNMKDFAVLAVYWLEASCVSTDWCGKADINQSGEVDLADLIELADQWLNGVRP
jgi:hypothetical protein